MKQKLAVPKFFLDNKMLGVGCNKKFNFSEGWIQFYAEKIKKLGIKNLDFLNTASMSMFFLSSSIGGGKRISFLQMIYESMAFKYFDADQNETYCYDEYITWTYKNREVTCENRQNVDLSRNEPFTVLTLYSGDRAYQNLIYDAEGKVFICVDFEKHGNSHYGHFHLLIPGNLDREEGENHSYPWELCPWVWLAVSLKENSVRPSFGKGSKGVPENPWPVEIIEIDLDEMHENPTFSLVEGFGPRQSTTAQNLENFLRNLETAVIEREKGTELGHHRKKLCQAAFIGGGIGAIIGAGIGFFTRRDVKNLIVGGSAVGVSINCAIVSYRRK